MKTYEATEGHDWDELKAEGKWMVCEQKGVIAKTRSGIHVPDNARMAVWVVISVGADVRPDLKGARVLFTGHTAHNIDGRIFAILQQDQIMATLNMPTEAAEPDESIPEVVPARSKVPADLPRLVLPH